MNLRQHNHLNRKGRRIDPTQKGRQKLVLHPPQEKHPDRYCCDASLREPIFDVLFAWIKFIPG